MSLSPLKSMGAAHYTSQITNGIRTISNGTVSTLISQQQLMQAIDPGSDQVSMGLDVSTDGRVAVSLDNGRMVGIFQGSNLVVKLGANAVDDIDGASSISRFFFPHGVAFLANGDLLITDSGNHNIKRYSSSSNMVTLYTGKRNYVNPIDGVGSAAKLYQPGCLQVTALGEVWFNQDYSSGGTVIRKVDASGNTTTLPPLMSNGNSFECVLKVNSDGGFIAANSFGSKNLGEFDKTGKLVQMLSTQFDLGVFSHQSVVSPKGEIFFINSSNTLSKFSNGIVSVFSSAGLGSGLVALAITSAGDFIASDGCTVFNISTAGIASPLSATSVPCGYQDGAVGNAKFLFISGLAVGMDGAIYVSDLGNSVIRRIYNGNVDTIAGTLWVNETVLDSGMGGLYKQGGLAYDQASNSLILLTGNAVLRAQLP